MILDDIFRELRRIQRKERNESGLAKVGDDFYKKTNRYMKELMENLSGDPLNTKGYDLLRDVQRITTEICERREHKITDIAVMNVQRSYNFFKKKKLDLGKTPSNLTPEEQKLYISLLSLLMEHRSRIFPVFQEKKKPNETDANNTIPKSENNKIETVLIYEEIPSTIVGVDEKIYGPFQPQDVVRLPSTTARVLVNSGKGRLIKH